MTGAAAAGARRDSRRHSGRRRPNTSSPWHVARDAAQYSRAARCGLPGSAAPPIRGFEFTAVSGRGIVRSWTVVRQAFLPGFDSDLPFVLVDVELVEQEELRLIGRLLDGVARRPSHRRRRYRRVRGHRARRRRPRFRARPVSGRFAAANGRHRRLRAQPGRRRADRPLGAQAVDTARAAIADAGLQRGSDRRVRQLEPAAERGRPQVRGRNQHCLVGLAGPTA